MCFHASASAFAHAFVAYGVLLRVRIVSFAVLVNAAFDPMSFGCAWMFPENNEMREIKHHKQEPPFVLH